MSKEICCVCKNEIIGTPIYTSSGPVHQGPCLDFISERSLSESEELQNLQEVHLLT